jgi:NADH:ubiquinone reductase (H+-translocating)
MTDKPISKLAMPHRVIVVGGGAGGLELATRLGNYFRRKGRERSASITLVDQVTFHIWKPLLHEVAAGVLDANKVGLDYTAHGRRHGFEFCLGSLAGIHRTGREIFIAPVNDAFGNPLHPQRTLPYDTLVLALGSTTNFFSVPGAEEYAFALDSTHDADRLRSTLISLYTRANREGQGDRKVKVEVAIVGGGATGVELAAELSESVKELANYDVHTSDSNSDVSITVVEAGPRILPPLPAPVASSATKILNEYGIAIRANSQVRQVTKNGLVFADGSSMQSDLVVWAAGINALPVLKNMDGLALGPRGQIVVLDTLQSENDESIFAMGDCAQCAWMSRETFVPPRAQAAHQQASFLFKSLLMRIKSGSNKGLPIFKYQDFGSLVSLGKLGAVGNLMGRLVGGRIFIDGMIARFMYVSLYQLHCVAIHGIFHAVVDALGHLLRKPISPRIKLH